MATQKYLILSDLNLKVNPVLTFRNIKLFFSMKFYWKITLTTIDINTC